jgi:phosphoglycerate dehydrogenase-like enzyme
VLAFDPFLSDERAAALGVRKCSLEELFAKSQVVSNHLANNPQTVGMLKNPLFTSMKPNATFLNTGRGAQVVEDDLIAALEERPDLTAVLDVTLPEPPVDGSRFYELPNVFLTPHIAGSLGDEVWRMSEYMLEEFRRAQRGEAYRYAVTIPMLATMA